MPAPASLTLRELRVRAVNVPMNIPLQTSGGAVTTAPFVLIDLVTGEGVTGSSCLFCYTPLAMKPIAQFVKNLEEPLKGVPVSPLEINRKLQGQVRLLGARGIAGMAIAGVDMAAWDVLARARNLPLVRLLGGDIRPVQAYNSCGLGMIGPDRAAAEAEKLAAPGFRAVKVRLGYPDLKTDIEVVRSVRRAVGDDILIMSDYNQSMLPVEASRRVRALENEGLYWVEEPVQEDDYAGCARVREKSGIPIQIGENWWGSGEMAKSIAAGASDMVMPDAMKIGGVTGWLKAAAIAEAAGLPISSHGFPEISVHLLAASPACHWLEYVDWAEPILQMPLRLTDGCFEPSDAPGSGISWNEENVTRFAVDL